MTKHSHLGLVLISGPPGTGKSTFCNQLKCHLINSTQKNAISISFDKVIDKKLENSMISAASSDWKTGRSIVFTLIALLGEYLNQISSLKGGFSSLQLYFNSKLDKELVSSEYFKAILDNFFHCLDQDFAGFQEDDLSFIILLDDIFYYESMRLMYFRLAFNHKFSYFSYCIRPIDLEFLMHRNDSRCTEQKLSSLIIENIFSKFEYPNRIVWEQDFCYIQTDEEPIKSIEDKSNVIMSGLQKFNEYLVIVQKEQAVLEESRTTGEVKSLVHEADLVLRKIVSSTLIAANSVDKVQLAQQLNTNKNRVLNELRRLESLENCALYFKLNSLLLSSEKEEFEDELKRRILKNLFQ